MTSSEVLKSAYKIVEFSVELLIFFSFAFFVSFKKYAFKNLARGCGHDDCANFFFARTWTTGPSQPLSGDYGSSYIYIFYFVIVKVI